MKNLNKKKIEDKDSNAKRRSRRKGRRSKKELTPKQENIRKKIKKVISIIILLTILGLGISLGISTHTWKVLAKDMIVNENSIVKDIDGNTIAELGAQRKKNNITLSEVPNNLKNAYIAIEDERFYSHNGIDIKRTGSAILTYIFHFGSSSFGGSTITQQLVKNLTGDSTDSITRKVKEWWKAIQLETCLSKDEVLEAYFNVIYVGPNLYGVETGAKYYFDKSVGQLSLEESAFLAGINHSPNSYNPFADKDNKEKINKRTKIVLSKMLELNYINQEEYNEASNNLEKGLKFKKGDISSDDGVYSYHTDALILEITKDIEKKYNISNTFATNYINMAGLNIYSTQNSEIQKKMQNEFEKSKYIIKSQNGKDDSQAAMVIIDQTTGNVVGCTGGLGEKTKPRSLNRATQSIRQTGSAIKPIAVLAPAIDKKIITAASICNDSEKDFADGYHPTDLTNSLGDITVRRAVESSQNIPFVEIMDKLKPSKSIKYLKKMGITTLTEKDDNLALALGGIEKGISPLEMAGAYATIANDGIYIEPTFYSKVEKKNGSIVVKVKQKKKRVFSKEVAYVLKELLTEPVLGGNGTATYCAISGMDVAAKTGTTDENYDRWLCGFTPYYTAVSWYGYDENESIEYYEKNPAGLIWANVMSNVHSGLSGKKFEKPSSIKTTMICSETGKIANSGCPNSYEEYFLWLTLPEECTKHTGTKLNLNTNTKNNQDKQQNSDSINIKENNTKNEVVNSTKQENVNKNSTVNNTHNNIYSNNNTSTQNTIKNNTINNVNNSVTSTQNKNTINQTNVINTNTNVVE